MLKKKQALVIFITTLVLVSVTRAVTLPGASAQGRVCQKFAPTDRVICGKFLRFWSEHGGVPLFGYPLTNEFTEFLEVNGRAGAYTVQYFERAVFELHRDNEPPHDVQLRRLGAELLNSKYPQGNEEAELPLYPNATIQSIEIGATPLIRVTSFTTNDRPLLIFGLYKDFLLQKGWRIVRETTNTIRISKDLPFGASNTVYVETFQTGNDPTFVKLYYIITPVM